jgi:hypothetical protein
MKKAVEIKESNEIKQHSRPKLEPQKSGHEASPNHKPEAGRHVNAAHQERQTGQNHQGRHNQHAQGHQTPQRLSSQKIVTVKDAFEQEPAHKPANAPKPFIQHSEHRQKPVDQFLENKPFIRKG